MTHVDDARAQLSEMTEITETTIGSSVYRDTDLEALYRACPSAFWLAPGADLSIPIPAAPPPGTPPSCPAAQTEERALADGTGGAIWRALLAAGPVFTAIWMAVGSSMPGDSWLEPLGRAAASVFMAPFSILFGAILGIVPIAIGTFGLSSAGVAHRSIRHPGVWLGTGAGMGLAIAALFQADGPAGLALIATSVACAAIARHAVDWDDPAAEPA